MAPPPTEAELPVLPAEMLAEILLRVSTPSTLVHAAAASKSCRTATIADPEFLARYRARNPSSPFLGVYVPRELAGPPSFLMPDSIRVGGAAARDLKDAARRAFDFGDTRRYQDHRLHGDAFILGSLEVHPDCRILDCHNGRLLLTRGDDEALEVRSPLARESILIPFPPDVVDPYDLQACLLHGHDKAAPASFRVVLLQHRRLGRGRWQTRAVEYDSRRKSWQDHPWETITSNIGGIPEELMHAGHRIFCRYRGLTSAALVLDTNSMQFSLLPLPKSHQSFVIGEMEDNVCCFAESVGCADHRLRVWQLDEKLGWDLKKDVKMDQVLGGNVGYYRPRAISNGIALVCSTTTTNHHHFVVDLKTCSMKEELEFQGQFAYPMQMPWPPVFSGPTANAAGGFDRDGGPTSVGDTRIGVGLSECIAKLERNTKAIADVGYQIAAILQDLKINAKPTVASGPPSPGCRVHGGSATNGFDDGGLAELSVGDANTNADARTGARESDEINDPSPGPSVGGCINTNPLSEAKKAQFLYSSSIACFVPSSSTAPSALMPSTTAGSPSCPHQVKKRAGSRQSKGSPKAIGLVRRIWKRKPKHLKTIDQRRRHLFSIASKICEVQIATSSCREASAASTASVFGGSGSTLKITDVGEQRIIDVSVTGARSLSDPSAGESAEQRGEAAQDSNEPQDIDIQDPIATPTSATTEQIFGKGKNYVSNDYLIPDICDPFSDLMNPKAAGGFGWVAEPAFVGNTMSGSGESDTIEDLFSGTLAMAPPAAPAVEPEELLIWRSRSPFCVQSLDNDLLLQPPALASCPQQGRKRADSRESKGSPEAKGLGKRNWKRPKYLEAIFDLRRHQSSSIASKISDEVHIATSSCTGESAASTAAVSAGECIPLLGGSSSTLKFTDVGKQPIIDVSITGAPSLSDPSAAESAEQRGKAAQDSNEPQDIDIQDPTAIAPTSATTEQSFGKDKNYVSNDYLISDEVQIATSSCTEESAASTAAVGSTFTDSGKQPIIDVSITRAPSLFYPTGELAEQRGEAVRGKGSPEATDRGRREKKLNPKYSRGDWLLDDDCPIKARAPYHQPPPPRSAPPKDTFPPSSCRRRRSSRRRRRFAATMTVEGEGKNPAGGGGGDNLQHQQAVLQAAPAPAVQGEAVQEPEMVAVEDPGEAAATSAIQEEMKALVASIPDGVAAAFTAMQLQELEQQSRVCQYMAARVPVPTHLVFPVWKSVTGASFEGAQKYPTLMGLATLCLDFDKNSEPEPGRCRRTDGLKWRCRRSTIPNEKYCERHMHRGRKRPVRVV